MADLSNPLPPPAPPPRAPAPWWFPDMRTGVLLGLFVLTGFILWWSRPAAGEEPSEFFKVIAQAIVLTGFLTAAGFPFLSSKGTAEANTRTDKVLDVVASTTAANPAKTDEAI